MDMKRTIFWVDAGSPLTVSARILTNGLEVGARESDIDPIQEWCERNNCGVRTSFDQFEFYNRADLVFFLLKWDNT